MRETDKGKLTEETIGKSLVRIIASDGGRSISADSASVTIEDHEPRTKPEEKVARKSFCTSASHRERAKDSYFDAGARGTGSNEETGSMRGRETSDTELDNLQRETIVKRNH